MKKIYPLNRNNFQSCFHLFRSYPFKPYCHYSNLAEADNLTNYFISYVRSFLLNDLHTSYLVGDIGEIQGALGWTRLPWDSQQLGNNVARIDYLIANGSYFHQSDLKDVLVQNLINDCIENDIDYIFVRIHSSDISSIHVLEKRGFNFIDGILTFSIDLFQFHDSTLYDPIADNTSEDFYYLNQDYVIRLARPGDIEQLKEIARTSYIYDRFHSDPRIPKDVADRLHAVWVENSCLGLAADAVIVAEQKGKILGFVTCKIQGKIQEYLGFKIGTIVLVATSKESRGKGIAKATTVGALKWFYSQGVRIVEVGTQIRNIPASRLYESCGFRLISTSLSFRKWID